MWRRRAADATGAEPPRRFTRDELGAPGRRLGAFAVDGLLGIVAALVLAVPVELVGTSDELEATVWWFLGVPVGFAAVTVPFMLRRGPHAGQSPGKQLFGLRVVCESQEPLGPGRATARELLVKTPFWTSSVALWFVPALVNGAWSILDPQRRGLQDRAAGTRVVRADRPPS
jgi:uncharacterized RDD family membrane protein YckC